MSAYKEKKLIDIDKPNLQYFKQTVLIDHRFLSARIASRASTSYSGLVLVLVVLVVLVLVGEVSRLVQRITSIYSLYKFRNV